MGMIINPYLVQPSGPSYGALTTAWIAATGETDLTILGALNTLESDLTTYGLTSKMKALYPMVGGTSTKHSYNFMNTAQYQISWNGGITHNSNGVTGNGTNGYGNTNLNYTTLNSGHQTLYSRSAVTESSAVYDMGAFNGGNTWQLLSLYTNANLFIGGFNSDSYPRSALSNSSGFFMNNRTASNAANLWRSGTKLVQSTQASSAIPNINNFLGALNNAGTAQAYSAKNYAFASIGDGLTDTEAANFYTAVQTFQTTLGRQVGVPIVSDADAQAFLNAAVITDTTQASAINTLVTGLKTDGLWTKMKAIYPFVGGTASTHKWNLKNPVDSDAAFRLVFSGGLTHDSNGIKGNATNGYYDTKFNPSVQLTSTTGGSAFFYCNNSVADNGSDLAANQSGVNTRFQVMSSYAGSFYASMLATNLYSAANTTTVGFFGATREPSNTTSFYAVKDTNSYSYSDSFANPNSNVAGLCVCTDSTSFAYFTGRRHSFSCMGEGLTTTEAQNLRSRVITFNTTLGR